MVFSVFHELICEKIPNIFKNIPIPAKFSDLKLLSFGDVLKISLFFGVSTGMGYCVYYTLENNLIKKKRDTFVNLSVDKDCGKVVHTIDLEDTVEKAVLCRCWRSKKFPYCDGSHVSHNNATGDNVGPVIVNRK